MTGSGRPSAARDRLLASAAAALASRGYHAAGTSEILRDAQVPSGVLYHHFGSKEALAVAAIEQTGAEVLAELDAALLGPGPLAERVAVVVDLWERRLLESDFTVGCPVAPTALEVGGSSPALRAAADAVYRSWLDRLALAATAAGHAPEQARRSAVAVLSTVEGALLLARALRSVEPLRAVRAALPAVLAASGAPS